MLMEPLKQRINKDGPLVVGSNYRGLFGSGGCSFWFSGESIPLGQEQAAGWGSDIDSL